MSVVVFTTLPTMLKYHINVSGGDSCFLIPCKAPPDIQEFAVLA